ncbi:CHAP domain-containing protein [Oscillospiraceae bacterium CM]|nr:CHAP domain-containing protein [Oscillospiraceae bacterium CM]
MANQSGSNRRRNGRMGKKDIKKPENFFEKLMTGKPPSSDAKTENDRIADEGVWEWLKADHEERSRPLRSKWPETEQELSEASPKRQALTRNPLAAVETMGYNGKEVPGLINLVSHAQSSLDLMERALAKTSGSEMKLTAGSAGDDVKRLQKMLNKLGVTDVNGRALEEDGVFGRHTLEAVNTYKDAAIPGGNTGTNRGIVGPSTFGRLTFDSTFNFKPPALRNSGISNVSGGGGSWGDDSGDGFFDRLLKAQSSTTQSPNAGSGGGFTSSVTANKYGIDTNALVEKALSQVGVSEKLVVDEDGKPILDSYGKIQGTNENIYGDWYGQNGVYWCAQFIDWCVYNSGISPDLIPNKRSISDKGINCASTGAYKNWYAEQGRYQDVTKDRTPPHEGDIVIFGEHTHIGIVLSYDEKTGIVYTIEGNSGQQVKINKYNLKTTTYITGFCLNGSTSYGRVPSTSSDGTSSSIR